jgi:hypothetical protein
MRRSTPLAATLAAAGLAVTAAAGTAGAATTLTVTGKVTGTYLADFGPPDSGGQYHLYRGHGTTSLGATTASGTQHAPGNIRTAYCNGSLLLVTSKGKVSVRIHSTTTYPGDSPCNNFPFTWRSVSTSGAYANESGSGSGTFVLSKADSTGHGTFTVTFNHS